MPCRETAVWHDNGSYAPHIAARCRHPAWIEASDTMRVSFIGTRRLMSERKRTCISFIPFVSVGSLALGAAAPIIVGSVMTGFTRQFTGNIHGICAHFAVLEEEMPFDDYREPTKVIRTDPGVVAITSLVQTRVMPSSAVERIFIDERDIVLIIGMGIEQLAPSGPGTTFSGISRRRRSSWSRRTDERAGIHEPS